MNRIPGVILFTAIVLSLAGCNRGPSPALSSSSPSTQPSSPPAQPSHLRVTPVPKRVLDPIEEKVLASLQQGRQAEAERQLAEELQRYPDLGRVVALMGNDPVEAQKLVDARADRFRGQQRLLFLAAACCRSRFMKAEAFPMFSVVYAINRETTAGLCSQRIIALDSNVPTEGGPAAINREFAALTNLAESNPDDVVVRWMLAVQCRTWNRNEEGARHYSKVAQAWVPGPSLLHQSYANILDELNRHEEALVERRIAVEQEPRSWSYDGLANTLSALGRYEEAIEAHEMAVKADPQRSPSYSNWAKTLWSAKKYEESIARCKEAIELHPGNGNAYWTWGNCLYSLGKKAEALEKFELAQLLFPNDERLRISIESLKKELGR